MHSHVTWHLDRDQLLHGLKTDPKTPTLCTTALCAVLNPQVLDISMNLIEGRLPGCLVNSLSELYVAGNSLGGPLPPFKPGNSLVTLYANQQHGIGFTGVFACVWGGDVVLCFLLYVCVD